MLLLRGRGRACGQAVQHLPDVEFPHGLAQGSPSYEAQVAEAPAAKESEPLKPRGGFDRGERRSSGEQKIIPTGRAATAGGRARGGEPSSSEAAAAAVAPDAASSPGRGRAPAVPRRCRRIHDPQPRSPSARPGLGLCSAQPPRQHGPDTRNRSPHRLSLSPRPPGRSLSPPVNLGPRPLTPGRAGGEPRFQRRPRRWRQLGLRGASCPVRMRAAAPAPGRRLKSSFAEDQGQQLADPRAPRPAPPALSLTAPAVCFQVCFVSGHAMERPGND